MERPVLRGQLILDPVRAGAAAEPFPRPPARPPLEARSHDAAGAGLRAPWLRALRAPV